jgi:hypothetical protein
VSKSILTGRLFRYCKHLDTGVDDCPHDFEGERVRLHQELYKCFNADRISHRDREIGQFLDRLVADVMTHYSKELSLFEKAFYVVEKVKLPKKLSKRKVKDGN